MYKTLKLSILSSLLFLAVGCNQSGMSLGGGSSSSGGSGDSGASSFFASSGSGDGLGGSSGSGGEQVALVHNPEPATMLLWGAGLAGAALLRRKKRI